MVDNNGFNRIRRRYNGSFRGNHRRSYNSSAVGSKGLLNFLFSFNGKISRNLLIGFSFLFAVIYSALNIAGALVENHTVNIVLSVISLVVFVSNLAISCKRAHALGISGIYSVFFFVCLPFFCFNKSDRDFGNDNVYKPRFSIFKKFGALVNKNVFTKIAYVFILFVIMFAPIVFDPSGVKGFVVATAIFVVINLLQMLLLKFRWFRHNYTGVVKVCTFVAYNLFVMGIAAFMTMLYILSRVSL